MAPSYDPQDALDFITPQLGNVSLDAPAKGICANNAQTMLWNIYPWRWARKTLPNITLVDGQQEYTGTNVPTDFMQLIQAECVRTDSTPNVVWEMDIKSMVYSDPQTKFFPVREIAYLQELNTQAGGFRVSNPSIGTGVTAVVRGVYRFTPVTKYISTNLTTNFAELPDQYFGTYAEVLMYYIYRYTGDPRAGEAQYNRKQRRVGYSGQLAVAMDSIDIMLEAEDAQDTETIFPVNPLGYFGRMTGRSILP